MKKRVFYPYNFRQSTWSIVIVLANIAKNLEKFSPHARNAMEDSQVASLSRLDQICGHYDILHIHSPTPYSVLSAILAKVQRKVIVFTGATIPNDKARYFKRYKLCARLADQVYAISTPVAEETVATCEIEISGIIPNGVDHEFFDRKKCTLPSNLPSHYFAIIGNISEGKNSPFILRLAKALPHENFVFVGDANSSFDRYLEDAKQLRNVYMVGKRTREEVRDYLGYSKALLFPTKLEGFGLVAVEALSLAKPVIAQPIPVMREVLAGFLNCSLIPIEEFDQWVIRLQTIREEHQSDTRAKVIDKYCWKNIAGQYDEIYEKLTGSN